MTLQLPQPRQTLFIVLLFEGEGGSVARFISLFSSTTDVGLGWRGAAGDGLCPAIIL